jgi:hypothetical protein
MDTLLKSGLNVQKQTSGAGGAPPSPHEESGEAGPLASAGASAGLRIRFWRKKSIDIELLLSNSGRPQGP